MTSARKHEPIRSVGAVLLALLVVATACGGSATVSGTTSPPAATTVDPASEGGAGAVEPTVSAIEPTAVAAEATPTPTDTPAPTPSPPASDLPPAEFRTDNILAISADGEYAYAGTTSAWNTETPCDAPPFEALAVVSLEAVERGEFAAVGGGVEQTGDIRQLIVGDEENAAILSSCGSIDDGTVWLQRAEIGAGGRVVGLGDEFPMGGAGEGFTYLVDWIDDETIEAEVTIEVDPDDYETWKIERRRISMNTGEILSAEQFDILDDNAFAAAFVPVTADGFTYRVIEDPNGSLGCEGFGIARTIELDDGDATQLALTQSDLRFSSVDNLQIAPTGHIAWTSGCEGYVSAYVGKVLPDGRIADAHLVDTYALESDSDDYADYQFYRLSADGFLVAVGQRYDVDTGESVLAALRYDLATDPNFVNTANPMPQIDAAPLFEALQPDASWHLGDTLAADRACGGTTLYGQTAGGFVRAFPAGIEIDAIVDADVAETRIIDFDDGQYISRTVVVQTECPGEYEGRRIWFGVESETVVYGLTFERADLGEVADVRSVRDVVEPGTDFVESSIVEVELFDGSIVDVELVPLPRD